MLKADSAGPPESESSGGVPQRTIGNGAIEAKLYLPDAKRGFYRGTRFDWSGVIVSLKYAKHDYYGPWFDKTDALVHDFVYRGDDIVAGPCSAITGPAEEFNTDDKALGYAEAKPGGTFIKIGIGVLRKPDGKPYDRYRLYDVVDPGKWEVHARPESIDFIQTLNDASSGYGYIYRKTVHLIGSQPEMVLEHAIRNTGRRAIQSEVYNHNFLVLDKQPPGPDFVITLPFQVHPLKSLKVVEAKGNEIRYPETLTGKAVATASIGGFGESANDYKIKIENRKLKAGMEITGDRTLYRESLWSIRSVLAMEPFIIMNIDPGTEFRWKLSYRFYSSDRTAVQ